MATLRRYASPEFLEGGRVDPIGDVYSLGLLAYELFTGRPLLPRGSSERTRRNQVEIQKALERVARVTRSVPIELSNVLRSMIQVEPAKRPRFGLELIGALDAAMPTQAAPEATIKELAPQLKQSLRRTAKSLLGEAHSHLEERQPLPAASCLFRAARLRSTLNQGDREVLSELLRRTLWRAFPAGNSQLDVSTERQYREALLLQIHRASLHAGEERLRILSGYRLSQIVDDVHPVRPTLPDSEDVGRLQALKPGLVRRLLRDRANSEERLTLATLTETFRPDSDASLQSIKGDLLRGFQNHSSPDTAHAFPGGDTSVPTPLPGLRKSQTSPPEPGSQEEAPFRELEIPSQAETLSEVARNSWISSSNPDVLVDLVLSAVEESELSEQKRRERKAQQKKEKTVASFEDPAPIHL
jgi:hypothetical protein